jgi:hypothetical protein
MSLHAYQTAIGRVIRGSAERRHAEINRLGEALDSREQAYLLRLLEGRGLPFTIDVQRSWCKGRARDAAYMTLSLLPESMQQQLLESWVERGGGTSSFFASEANDFLEFIAMQLEPRTHAYAICRTEQAVHRAARGNAEAAAPTASDVLSADAVLAISRYSTLVKFHCDPDQLFAAISKRTALPDIEEQSATLLFAPWIPGNFRYAQESEIRLLTRLRQLTRISELLYEGHDLQCIIGLVDAGTLVVIDD